MSATYEADKLESYADVLTPGLLAAAAAEVERTCRALAPLDLTPADPLYIVWAGELADSVGLGDWRGFTEPDLDVIASASLGERWRGRGRAMCLNERAILAEAVGIYPAVEAAGPAEEARQLREWARIGFRLYSCSVGVHELSHCLDDRLAGNPTPSALHVAAQRAWLATYIVEPPAAPTAAEIAADNAWHDSRMIRVALHLYRRAGWDRFRLLSLLDTTTYGLSAPWAYLDALGDEPRRLAGCSFAQIAAAPAPAPFLELYRLDVAARDATRKGISHAA